MLVWGTHRAASIASAERLLPELQHEGVSGIDIARTYFGGAGFRFAAKVLQDGPALDVILKARTADDFLPLAPALGEHRNVTLLLHNPERWLAGRPAPAEALADECERLLAGFEGAEGRPIGIAAWNLFDGGEGVGLLEAFLRVIRRRTSAPIVIQYPAGLVHLQQIADYHAGRVSIYAAGELHGATFCASSPFAGGRVFDLLTDDLVQRELEFDSVAELSLAVITSVPGVRRVAVSSNNPGHLRQAARYLSMRRDPKFARTAIERLL